MGTKARTETGDFLFAVKDGGSPDYRPWIVAEPRRRTTTLVNRDALMGFELSTKDRQKAEEIATFMNENIEKVVFVVFENHPMFSAKVEE